MRDNVGNNFSHASFSAIMRLKKCDEVKDMVKWLLFAALLIWAAPAQAMLTYNPEQSADRQLSFWDANHNGSVERAEYERLATAKFNKIDADDDDVITHTEMMAHRFNKNNSSNIKGKIRDVNHLIKRWDANGDLNISKDEYLRPVRADFERLDEDGNQSISRDELVAHWQRKKQEIEQQQHQAKHHDD